MRFDLSHLQKNFADALIDLNRVDSALACFSGNPDVNRERFGFYRGNISAIWQQTCSSAYPVLKQLLGDDFFDELARAYGRACPSHSGSLTVFGADMAGFIATLDNCRPYPYLSDVAALEWLVHRAYFLDYQEPATLVQLATIPVDELSQVRVQMQPGCALLASSWAIADIWLAHQEHEINFPDQPEKNNQCLVWQTPWKVHVSSLSEGSYAALKALQDGDTLGVALDRAMSVDPHFEVQPALADWFQKQLITSIISASTIP